MNPVEPIQTVELFPGLSAELLALLKTLPATAWDAATACPGWSVKDVAAHLLGGNLGRLSFGRDQLKMVVAGAGPLDDAGLVNFINRQNAEWVGIARQISSPLLIELLELTDPQLYQYFKALPPFEKSGIAVSWAGDAQSPWWFDIAREYTEKWLHQQHIREAVGWPVLAERKWLFPVLDTFLRALPHTYRDVTVSDGAAISLHVSGDAGGDWILIFQSGKWQLHLGDIDGTIAAVHIDQDTAWRLFTKGISPQSARSRMRFEGDLTLGMKILEMVSIIA